MSTVTYFKNQFPLGEVEEVSLAEFSEPTESFVNYDLNIGWSVKVVNSVFPFKKKSSKAKTSSSLTKEQQMQDKRVTKKYMGSLRCVIYKCILEGKEQKPPTKEFNILKKICFHCKSPVQWIKCGVDAEFNFSAIANTCVMRHPSVESVVRKHTHITYQAKHLSVEEKDKLDKEVVKETPAITPSSATAGIIPSSGKIVEPLHEINRILGNKNRAKYEIVRSRIRQGLANMVKGDGVAEYNSMEANFPNFIHTAELMSAKFNISFCSPEIAKYNLSFSKHPIITDITYNAVAKGYYLCSSVIYIDGLDKHIVIYQSIINGLSTKVFKTYNLVEGNFLGCLMDFSKAQRLGFQEARSKNCGMSNAKSLSYLKGCYMH